MTLNLWGCGGSAPAQVPPEAIVLKPKAAPSKVADKISEVSPPEVITQLREVLDRYQPQVAILTPKPNELLNDNTVSVSLGIRDLKLFKDQTLGLGPHIHLFLDDQPYQAVYDTSQPIVLKDLAPGTHTLRAFASRPWHESFKNEGAYAQTTFHVLTKTADNNPDRDQPLLTYSRPQGSYGAEPIMLDFYLTNAPLHFVAQEDEKDEVSDWRVRVTINGSSFVVDRWQPIYLKGIDPGKNWVQLEYIDESGKPIRNVYNNPARLFTYEPGGTDTLSKLVRGELSFAEARGIVDPNYKPPAKPIAPAPTPEVKAPAPVPEVKAPEVKKPEVKKPEVKKPEVKAPEVKAPEVKAPAPVVSPSPEAKQPGISIPPIVPIPIPIPAPDLKGKVAPAPQTSPAKADEKKEAPAKGGFWHRFKSQDKPAEAPKSVPSPAPELVPSGAPKAVTPKESISAERNSAGTVPEVKKPEVKAPEVKVPEIKKPEVKAPEVKKPEVKVPEVKKPEVKVPEVKKPEVKKPSFNTPEVKKPDIKVPDIKAPDLTMPEVKVPEIKVPEKKVEVKTPEVKKPEVKAPEVKKPEIKVPIVPVPVPVPVPNLKGKATIAPQSTPAPKPEEKKPEESPKGGFWNRFKSEDKPAEAPKVVPSPTATIAPSQPLKSVVPPAPAIKVPEVKKPEVKAPEVKKPEIKVPEIKKPEVKVSPAPIVEKKEANDADPIGGFFDRFRQPEKPAEAPKPAPIATPNGAPKVTAPAAVKVPELRKPEIKGPEVKKPEVKVPAIKVPEVKKPEVKVSPAPTAEKKESSDTNPIGGFFDRFRQPEKPAEVPAIAPKVTAPAVKKPEVKVPEIKKPEVKVPEVKKPEVKVPVVKAPEVKKPEVKVPDVKKPEVKASPIGQPKAEKPAEAPKAAEPKENSNPLGSFLNRFKSDSATPETTKAPAIVKESVAKPEAKQGFKSKAQRSFDSTEDPFKDDSELMERFKHRNDSTAKATSTKPATPKTYENVIPVKKPEVKAPALTLPKTMAPPKVAPAKPMVKPEMRTPAVTPVKSISAERNSAGTVKPEVKAPIAPKVEAKVPAVKVPAISAERNSAGTAPKALPIDKPAEAKPEIKLPDAEKAIDNLKKSFSDRFSKPAANVEPTKPAAVKVEPIKPVAKPAAVKPAAVTPVVKPEVKPAAVKAETKPTIVKSEPAKPAAVKAEPTKVEPANPASSVPSGFKPQSELERRLGMPLKPAISSQTAPIKEAAIAK